MSSPICANCSRDSSRAGLGIGPVAQVETEKQVGTGVEVICSQSEVRGPVEVDSVPVFAGPEVTVRGSAVALIGLEAMEVLSFATVNVSAVEVIGPRLKTSSVDEVRCSVVKSAFFAILSAACVIHVGPSGLVGLASEVVVSVIESTGPVVKVGTSAMDPVLEATDSVLEV